jgi:hypothetical protein
VLVRPYEFCNQSPVCGNAGRRVFLDEIAISNAVFAYLAAVGRMDTIAHEIGHSLGLDDCSGYGGNDLMAGGAIRYRDCLLREPLSTEQLAAYIDAGIVLLRLRDFCKSSRSQILSPKC